MLILTACADPDALKQAEAGTVADPATSAETGTDTPTDPAAASVRILSPPDGATVENPVNFVIAASGVATVALDADGWALAAWDPAEGDSTSYSFSGTGYSRLLTLQGLDADGQVVATDQIEITVAAPFPLEVPYYYQMDNAYEPSSTCGITTAAMLVDYWSDGAVSPDSLYLAYGKSQAQSPSGLAQLYEWEGLDAEYGTGATRAELRAHLDAGRPVAVHGWWTSAGHITLLVGYDDAGWYVHDPAGDWGQGYFNPGGEAVHYPYGGGWDEALSTDGDIWYSTAQR